jgi:predicted RNase H-like nuclease (RuvC/YqgF family)
MEKEVFMYLLKDFMKKFQVPDSKNSTMEKFEDFFDAFNEFVEKAKKENPFNKPEADFAEGLRKEMEELRAENAALKDRLKDKEEIIELLKDQIKSLKNKPVKTTKSKKTGPTSKND